MPETNPFGARLLNEDGTLTEPWYMYLHDLSVNLSTGERFGYVTYASTPSGTVIDRVAYDGNRAVFYFYNASDGTNTRAGIVGTGWNESGTLLSDHLQMDAVQAGDTTDLSFSFAKSSDNINLTLTATTNTYTFRAVRLVV